MTAKEAQLTELLSLSTRTLTHLTAAITAMSFELLNTQDNAVNATAHKMIERMLADYRKVLLQHKEADAKVRNSERLRTALTPTRVSAPCRPRVLRM